VRMLGNRMGAIKAKLGLRGKTKPGEMIARMNKIKQEKMKVDVIKKII
jgi:hypothetical protein